MQKYFLSILFLCLIFLTNSCYYFRSTKTDKPSPKKELMGYWNLEGNANDQSSYHVNGSIHNKVTFKNGIVGKAAMFDGDDNYIEIPNYLFYNNMDSFTLSAWIYPTTFDKYNAIISKVTPNRDFVLQLFKGKINSHFAINFDTYYHCFSDNQVELATWSYIAAVWTGNKWLLYLNGSLIKESAVSDASPQWTGTRMGIGSMDDAYTFQGMIDEVKVFSRELTAEEIMSEYSNDRK